MPDHPTRRVTPSDLRRWASEAGEMETLILLSPASAIQLADELELLDLVADSVCEAAAQVCDRYADETMLTDHMLVARKCAALIRRHGAAVAAYGPDYGRKLEAAADLRLEAGFYDALQELAGLVGVELYPETLQKPKPASRWHPADETSPSGRMLFDCRGCGRRSPTPDKHCPAGCGHDPYKTAM